MSIRSQAARIAQATGATLQKARTQVLRENPSLYTQATTSPVLAEGDGTIAEIVAAAMSVALKKKLDAGIPVGIASRDLMRDDPALRQLAALAQSDPAACGLGMVEASARITKSRPDVDVPGLLRQVLTPDVIIKLGKRRGL